jgi:hypothetical protein
MFSCSVAKRSSFLFLPFSVQKVGVCNVLPTLGWGILTRPQVGDFQVAIRVGSALLFRWGQYVVLPKSFIAFDGRESVRFASPVRIGDTIQCEARVKSLSEKDEKRGIIELESFAKNQKEEIVSTYISKILVARRE